MPRRSARLSTVPATKDNDGDTNNEIFGKKTTSISIVREEKSALAEEEEEEEENVTNEEKKNVVPTTTTTSTATTVKDKTTSKKNKKNNDRLLRKQRNADLRKRNLGVGIGKIDIHATPTSSKKITFDDDMDDDVVVEEESHSNKNNENDHDDENSVSSSDDEVEEVKSMDARKKVLEQLATERETKRMERKLKRPKSKKQTTNKLQKNETESTEKISTTNIDAGDNDDISLDEDLLAMVDAEEEMDRKEGKRKSKLAKSGSSNNLPLNKHTTFVSEEDGVSSTQQKPFDVAQNVQVVVLPTYDNNNNTQPVDEDLSNNDSSFQRHSLFVSSTLGTKPSKAAVLFSRDGLGQTVQSEDDNEDDLDQNFAPLGKNKRRNRDQPLWKRSKRRKFDTKNRIGRSSVVFKV